VHSLCQPPLTPLRRGLSLHRALEELPGQLIHLHRARILLPRLTSSLPAHLRQLLLLPARHLPQLQPAAQDSQGDKTNLAACGQQALQASPDRTGHCQSR